MIGGHQSVAVGSFGLVDPQFDHFLGLDELGRVREQHALENV